MNLQYILLAAKTMSEKAEKENACGLSSAKQAEQWQTMLQ